MGPQVVSAAGKPQRWWHREPNPLEKVTRAPILTARAPGRGNHSTSRRCCKGDF